METSEMKKLKLKKQLSRLIGEEQLIEFLSVLMSLYDVSINRNSYEKRKAELLFKVMKKDKWTILEFNNALNSFIKSHSKSFWMPADFLKYRDDK